MSVLDQVSFREILAGALAQSGLCVSTEAIEGMARHFALVLEANETLNLTAIVEPAEAAAKHYCDSLAVTRAMEGFAGRGGEAVDVGAGAGFPGVPLALARPDWRWTLIEARGKKAEFLTRASEALGLANVRVCPGRSEDLARRPDFRDRFDLAVGRALAPLGAVAELLLPLVRPGGLAVAMKGPSESAPSAAPPAAVLDRLGAAGPEWIECELPGGFGKRALAVFRKIALTPPEFPRRPGMAEKRPLF